MEKLQQEMAVRWAGLTRQAADLQRQIEERRAMLDATLGAAQELEHWLMEMGVTEEDMRVMVTPGADLVADSVTTEEGTDEG